MWLTTPARSEQARDMWTDTEAQDGGEGGVSGSDGCETKNTPPSQRQSREGRAPESFGGIEAGPPAMKMLNRVNKDPLNFKGKSGQSVARFEC